MEVPVEAIRQEKRIPALGAVVLHSQRVLSLTVVGRRRADKPMPVQTEDRFHLGSCTKAMTATLIARLVDAGKVRWNQTLGEAFPHLRTTMHEAYRAVTLEQQALYPAGGVHCTLRDWARFAQLHLQIAQGKSVALLKAGTAAKLHADPYRQGYAMGWLVLQRDWAKGNLLVHDGSNTMWYAIALLAPALDRAWLVVTNCGSESAVQACEQLLQHLTGIERGRPNR